MGSTLPLGIAMGESADWDAHIPPKSVVRCWSVVVQFESCVSDNAEFLRVGRKTDREAYGV